MGSATHARKGGERRSGSRPLLSGRWRPCCEQDVGEIACKRGARQHLLGPGFPRRANYVRVDVRDKSQRPDAGELGVRFERGNRPDGICLLRIEVEDDERRPVLFRALENVRRCPGKNQIDAGLLRDCSDFRAKEEIVHCDEDHPRIIAAPLPGSGLCFTIGSSR